MTEICRTCLQEVGDGANVFYLDALESQSETITIRCKLADCVPEMDLDVVPNAFICSGCFESLTIAHEFKNKCLETEGRIQSYIEQMGYVLTCVDLREIVQQTKRPVEGARALSTRDSSRDTNENLIETAGASSRVPEKISCGNDGSKGESLDLKNLQCDTRAFFAAPKIAQLLAKDNGSLHRCSQCTYVACSDLDLKSHEDVHFNHKPQLMCEGRSLFGAPKIAELLAESGDFDAKPQQGTLYNQKPQKGDSRGFFPAPKAARLLTKGPHNCNQCTYVASSELDLQSHEESHFKSNSVHKCTECDYSAPKRQTLIVHMRKHSGTKPYHCKECGYSTGLSRHVRAHTDERPFKCDLCNYRGRLKFDLKIHMRVHGGDKPYRCPLCDYSSSHKTNLGYHMRNHAGSRSYKCKVCDYKSLQKTNLQSHLRTHADEHRAACGGDKQPYACTFCDFSSSAKVNLIKHVMGHGGEKPFQCFDCGYRTVAKVELERHMRVHFNENSSACSVCLKAFGDLENLRQHMRNHSGKLAVDSAAHIGSDLSESTSDTSCATHGSADFQLNRDTNNCESAVKKEMII